MSWYDEYAIRAEARSLTDMTEARVISRKRFAKVVRCWCPLRVVTIGIITFALMQVNAGLANSHRSTETKYHRNRSRPIASTKVKRKSSPQDLPDIGISFVDVGPFGKMENKCGQDKLLLPWKRDEREIVRSIFVAVQRKFPGLVKRAAASQSSRICRVASLPTASSIGAPYVSSAQTCCDAILISNDFFALSRSKQMESVIHELVHGADFGCQISYSKKFVQFANPIISRLRLAACLSGSPAQFQQFLEKHADWPSLYAAENLPEALAECFVSTTIPRSFDGSMNFSKYSNRLLRDNNVDISFLQHYKAGRRFLEIGDYEQSQMSLLEAARLDPAAAMPHVYLTRCSIEKKNYKAALQHSERALRNFHSADVPSTESNKKFLLNLRAKAFIACNRINDALLTLDDILSHNADDPEALYNRAHCLESVAQYSAAAQDLAAIVSPNPISCIVATGVDIPTVTNTLDRLITSHPQSASYLWWRANWHQFAAEHLTSGADQVRLYRAALADLERILPTPSISSDQLTVMSAAIYLKLNKLGEAENLCNSVSNKDTNVACEVVQIGLLEAAGKTDDARSKYLQLKGALLKGLYAHPPR